MTNNGEMLMVIPVERTFLWIFSERHWPRKNTRPTEHMLVVTAATLICNHVTVKHQSQHTTLLTSTLAYVI